MNKEYNTSARMLQINREDMLALTRRMTVKRTSITRIAGAYMDSDGFIDGTFNTRFLKLSGADRTKNLEIAKAIPFAQTNGNLKRYVIPEKSRGQESLYRVLMAIRDSGLENDALLEIFYEMVGEKYHSEYEYAVLIFHDRYDIPAKAADHVRLGESEQMFEYLIGAVCPVSGDYEAGRPECGFLFPSFSEGGALMNCIDIYQADILHPHKDLEELLL
mgnify:CR=1 FL=1